MYPEKFVKDLESSRRRKQLAEYVATAAIFVFTAVVAGPVLHEAAHAGWLRFHGCGLAWDLGLTDFGLHGEVQPLCTLNDIQLLAFYLSGYLATLAAGASITVAGAELEDSHYLLTLGSGVMMSILLSLNGAGDLAQASEVAGAGPGAVEAFRLLLMLGIFGSTLWSTDLVFERLEREE